MAKKRPYDLTNIVKSAITGTHKVVLDKSTSVEAFSTELNNILPGLISVVEIGSWNMKETYYKQVYGVPQGYISMSVIIYDDDGKPHLNGIYDLRTMASTVVKTAMLDNYNQAYHFGQPPLIAVTCRMDIINSENVIKLQHNCPGRFNNTYANLTHEFTDVTIDLGVNNQYDSFIVRYNQGDTGISYSKALKLRIDDVIMNGGNIFENNTKITSVDCFYDDQYDTKCVRVTVNKKAKVTGIFPLTLDIKRASDSTSNVPTESSNYESQIKQITESSGGNPQEGNGYFYPTDPTVLSKFSDNNANRGFIILLKLF